MTDMQYSLMVFGQPASAAHTCHALEFARAVVSRGHHLGRIFFYGDGVLNAREDHHEAWQKLAASHPCELVLCSASAERHDLEHPPEPFLLMGLGALMEAGVDSDRVIGFG